MLLGILLGAAGMLALFLFFPEKFLTLAEFVRGFLPKKDPEDGPEGK